MKSITLYFAHDEKATELNISCKQYLQNTYFQHDSVSVQMY